MTSMEQMNVHVQVEKESHSVAETCFEVIAIVEVGKRNFKLLKEEVSP